MAEKFSTHGKYLTHLAQLRWPIRFHIVWSAISRYPNHGEYRQCSVAIDALIKFFLLIKLNQNYFTKAD